MWFLIGFLGSVIVTVFLCLLGAFVVGMIGQFFNFDRTVGGAISAILFLIAFFAIIADYLSNLENYSKMIPGAVVGTIATLIVVFRAAKSK